jgi:hypothetical protein
MKQRQLSLITSPNWQDYELLDSGNLRKFERFGQHRFIRPEPQAMWQPRLGEDDWVADGVFVPGKNEQDDGEGGGAADALSAFGIFSRTGSTLGLVRRGN